jgi:methylglutaconyl-CoA hydratase
VREQLAELADISAAHFLSSEGREGVRAFAEKRSPSWLPQGRSSA